METLVEKSIRYEPDEMLFDVLRDRFERHKESIMTAVEARSRDRLKYLESTLDRRKRRDITDIENVLDELKGSIARELKQDSAPKQLLLWPDEERTQLSRDIQALETRLTRIPEELENEKSAIEKRYLKPADRTFPVAVIFLVPKSQTTGGRLA
jgi:septal ring factor EnvC (AmiA/AmiB activator)